jgi:hypothetical protein
MDLAPTGPNTQMGLHLTGPKGISGPTPGKTQHPIISCMMPDSKLIWIRTLQDPTLNQVFYLYI